MSLQDQIKAQAVVIQELEEKLKQARLVMDAFKAQRVDCKHVFSKPFKGYEHEGGYCSECGVNEVYASSMAKLRDRTMAATATACASAATAVVEAVMAGPLALPVDAGKTPTPQS